MVFNAYIILVDGVGEKFNFWPWAATTGRCGKATSKAGRRLWLGWRRQPWRPGNCAGSGSGRHVGAEAEKLWASPTGQGSVWGMYKLFERVGMQYEYRNCVRMKCNLQQMRTKTALKVRWFALLYSSACLTWFPTANKCRLTKLAAITVVQDITVLQHIRRLSNISQSTLYWSKWAHPDTSILHRSSFVLDKGLGMNRGLGIPFHVLPQIFTWIIQALTPDYVVLLCRLFTLGCCLDGNWDFTSAVLLNTATFILPLETASKNSCSQQNIQIFQRIFSLTLVFFSSAQWSFWFSSCDCKPDWPFRQRTSCLWHLRCQALFIICEDSEESF